MRSRPLAETATTRALSCAENPFCRSTAPLFCESPLLLKLSVAVVASAGGGGSTSSPSPFFRDSLWLSVRFADAVVFSSIRIVTMSPTRSRMLSEVHDWRTGGCSANESATTGAGGGPAFPLRRGGTCGHEDEREGDGAGSACAEGHWIFTVAGAATMP